MDEVTDNSKAKSITDNLLKVARQVIIVLSEIGVIGFIGANIGIYLSNFTIQADCAKVNLAKIGPVYVQCTIVEPKKDSVTQPPR